MKTPGNTTLDPKWHVEDAVRVSFAQECSINRLISDLSLQIPEVCLELPEMRIKIAIRRLILHFGAKMTRPASFTCH